MAAGLTGLLPALVLLLLQQGPRRSGTDLTPNGAFVVTLNGGEAACQGQELLPADTAAMQMTIGTYGRPGPPLRVEFVSPDGQLLRSARLAQGWREGVVRIPIERVSRPTGSTRACVRNEGRVQIALAGTYPDPGYTMQVAGGTVQERRLRIDYLRPGRESWLALLPTLVYRSTLGKSNLVRHWAWVAVVVLMALVVVLAARTIIADAGSAQRSGPLEQRPGR